MVDSLGVVRWYDLQWINLKKLSSIFGKLLVFASFVFIILLIYKLDFSEVLKSFKLSWIPIILLLAIMYGFLSIFLALAWKKLLELCTNLKLNREVLSIYLKTVIYKYIPGNVFHFLGRHSIVKLHDISHKNIAFANALEIILQLLSVLFIILISSLVFGFEIDFGDHFTISYTKIALAFALLIFVVGVVLFKKEYRDLLFQKDSFLKIFFVLANYVAFLLISALILFLVYYLFFDLKFSVEIFFSVIFVGLIAWLLGFVVPGAPGGVGIREAIILLLLPKMIAISPEITVAGALIYRVVTLLGEVLTLFLAKLFYAR